MHQYKASPKANISMPAKGTINHNPCQAKANAIVKETQNIVKKNIWLPRLDKD